MKTCILTFLVLIASAAQGANSQVVNGLYLRYERAEYESALLPCSSKGVWYIKGEEALEELKERYRNLPRSKHGEIWVSLELVVEPVNKSIYPNAHYEATAFVKSILKAEFDGDKIEAYRG